MVFLYCTGRSLSVPHRQSSAHCKRKDLSRFFMQIVMINYIDQGTNEMWIIVVR